MENEMDSQEIVESYLEDYFGHDLIETLTAEEIAEAVSVVNNLANTVNEFYGINEVVKKTRTPDEHPTLDMISPDGHAMALQAIRNHIDLHRNFGRISGPPSQEK
tara:strand:+ start:372 stop:686 length:315 start_codon:yes stop_codon:yes gene_type:complete